MKDRNVFGLMLSVMLLLLAAGSVRASEPQATGPTDAAGVSASPGAKAPWFISKVDSGPRVGSHVSLAIDDSGTTYISYYDAVNEDLKMAKSVNSGGNCGPDSDWSCEIVESSGNVGRYSSIAIDPTTNLPVIAYLAGNDLKLATAWGDTWDIIVVDGNQGYTSLKIDSTGAAHIAYYYQGNLEYAKRVGSGGNCGGNNYECYTIDDCSAGSCAYPSLALDGSGQPRIAYFDTGQGDLWYAQPGTPGNCGPGDTWGCYQVDTTGDVGRYASLDVDNGDLSHIAYYDATNGNLMYAAQVGSGGNCGLSNSWQCDEIATMGAQSTHPRTRDVSLAVDKAGLPIIAYSWYYGAPFSGRGFSRARPAAALGPQSGNCSPQDLWQCEGIQGGSSTGGYSAVAVNPSGLATIAYNYNYSGLVFEGSLSVAYQRFQVCLPLVMKNQ